VELVNIVLVINWVIRVLIWLIIIDAVLTWIPSVNRYHPLVTALRSVTRPILEPFRKLVPPERTGYIDISPLLAIIALQILSGALAAVARGALR